MYQKSLLFSQTRDGGRGGRALLYASVFIFIRPIKFVQV
jgi:hypothetical protein